MLRYWISGLLILAPCLLLVWWADHEIDRRLAIDRSERAATWRVLAQGLAREQLAVRLRLLLETVDQTLISGGDWQRFRTLAANPMVQAVVPTDESWQVLRHGTPAIPLGDHPLLLTARRQAFVEADPESALGTYRTMIADVDLDHKIRDLAWAGLIALYGQRGAHGEVVAHLGAWLDRHSPSLIEPALETTLDLYRAGVVVDDLLLALWRRVHEEERPLARRLLFDLDAAIASRRGAFDDSQRRFWDTRRDILSPERRSLTWWLALDPAQRATAIMSRSWQALDDEHTSIVVWRADRVSGRQAVIALDSTALAIAISNDLMDHPAVVEAARGLADTLDGQPLSVMTSWGEELAVPPPIAGAPPADWSDPTVLARLLLMTALVAVGAGFAALVLAARRDRRLARLKADFVSGVSHELKTPLSLIRLYGDMLREGYHDADDTARTQVYDIIVEEAERLGQLVETVLDFGRIERGQQEYQLVSMDLAALIRQVCDSYRPQVLASGCTLTLEIEDDLPAIMGDSRALTQVVLNLLTNACRFSPEGGAIRVGLRRDEDRLHWSITDQGIGIPVGEQQRIFDPFHRLESGLTRATSGTGIGLALVRHIVAGHGGTITVVSAPGSGSTFHITLPLGGRP